MECDKTVLVIAADATLRRSLAFLLEAEGYAVATRDTLPDLPEAFSRQRCAIVDDNVIDCPGSWERLERLADAVLVLLSQARAVPQGPHIHTLEKPHLGASLVEAVKAATPGECSLRNIA